MLGYALGFLWLAIIASSIAILEGQNYLNTILGLTAITISLFGVVFLMDRIGRK